MAYTYSNLSLLTFLTMHNLPYRTGAVKYMHMLPSLLYLPIVSNDLPSVLVSYAYL